ISNEVAAICISTLLIRFSAVLVVQYSDAKVSCYICNACNDDNYASQQSKRDGFDFCKTFGTTYTPSNGVFTSFSQSGSEYPIDDNCGTNTSGGYQLLTRWRCCNTDLCNTISFGFQDKNSLTAADNAYLNSSNIKYSAASIQHLFLAVCFVILISFYEF
ncbi:unnamed protein product, partial [Rotaria socialis]